MTAALAIGFIVLASAGVVVFVWLATLSQRADALATRLQRLERQLQRGARGETGATRVFGGAEWPGR